MGIFSKLLIFFISLLILASCTTGNKQQSPSSTNLTIKPYELNEKEEMLISKTGNQFIEFFALDGTLKKDDDLEYSVEVYENGKLKDEAIATSGEVGHDFNDTIISFSMRDYGPDAQMVTIFNGFPSGLASTEYPNKMTTSSYRSLIEDKIKLKKDEPVYLAYWIGTTKDGLSGLSSENGKLPDGLKETELAFLYKVKLIDAKERTKK